MSMRGVNSDRENQREKGLKMSGANLFTASLLSVGFAVKEAMNLAAQKSGMSRDQIVDQMEEIARKNNIRLNQGNAKKLSVDMLEKWLNPNAAQRIGYPEAMVVFCKAVGSVEPLAAGAAPLCAQVIDQRQAVVLEWAENQVAQKRLKKRFKELDREVMND